MSIASRYTRHEPTRTSVGRRTTLVLVLAVVASESARAQERAPLRLGDLYGQVERANPRITAAQALAAAARARVSGTRRPPDPQLQLGFMNYSLPGLSPMPTLGMSQLQLVQMLPFGGKLRSAGQAAAAQASATGERARDVAWETRRAACRDQIRAEE